MTLLVQETYKFVNIYTYRGDVAQEVEAVVWAGRRVAGSIPPWACRSVPEQDT